MNEHDIDEAVRILEDRGSPAAPYARYLQSWCDILNTNSDGWPYWSVGHKAANKLSELLGQAVMYHRLYRGEEPGEPELRKALGPIKAAATKNNLPQPSADGS